MKSLFLNKVHYMGFSILIHSAVGLSMYSGEKSNLAPKGQDVKGSLVYFEPLQSAGAPRIGAPSEELKEPSQVTAGDEEIPSGQQTSTQFGRPEGSAGEGQIGNPEGEEISLRERYFYELRLWIEARKKYPALAKKFREVGLVKVRFTIQVDGTISEPAVILGASSERLNQAALALIAESKKFKPMPQEIAMGSVSLELPIEYQID